MAVDGEGRVQANPSQVTSWFLEPMDTDHWKVERDATREVHDSIERFIDNAGVALAKCRSVRFPEHGHEPRARVAALRIPRAGRIATGFGLDAPVRTQPVTEP